MRRIMAVDGQQWEAYLSGRITVYDRDQLSIIFEQGTGPQRRRRVTRYTPTGSRAYDRSFAELSDRELVDLFRSSQPAWTAPEVAYAAR